MRVNESAAASTKVVGAAAIISRALYQVLTNKNTRNYQSLATTMCEFLLINVFKCHGYRTISYKYSK